MNTPSPITMDGGMFLLIFYILLFSSFNSFFFFFLSIIALSPIFMFADQPFWAWLLRILRVLVPLMLRVQWGNLLRRTKYVHLSLRIWCCISLFSLLWVWFVKVPLLPFFFFFFSFLFYFFSLFFSKNFFSIFPSRVQLDATDRAERRAPESAAEPRVCMRRAARHRTVLRTTTTLKTHRAGNNVIRWKTKSSKVWKERDQLVQFYWILIVFFFFVNCYCCCCFLSFHCLFVCFTDLSYFRKRNHLKILFLAMKSSTLMKSVQVLLFSRKEWRWKKRSKTWKNKCDKQMTSF